MATATPASSSLSVPSKKTNAPRRARALLCGTEAPAATAKEAKAPARGLRGDLAKLLQALDPEALSLARHAFDESRRRGLIDRRFDLDAFLCDAIAERARRVTLGLLGFSDEAIFDVRPRVDGSGEQVRTAYFDGGL